MSRAIILSAILVVTWLMLSGHGEFLLVALGVVSSMLVILLARRMALIDEEGVPLQLRHHILTYWGWLLVQIVKSNIELARIVLSPSLPISPRFVEIAPLQHTDLARVILANSITLTPGTVTSALTDGTARVHALTEDIGRDLEGGDMNRRVAALERVFAPQGED